MGQRSVEYPKMKKELINAIDDEEIQKLYEKTEKWENM